VVLLGCELGSPLLLCFLDLGHLFFSLGKGRFVTEISPLMLSETQVTLCYLVLQVGSGRFGGGRRRGSTVPP
jgi:hypothetical protein